MNRNRQTAMALADFLDNRRVSNETAGALYDQFVQPMTDKRAEIAMMNREAELAAEQAQQEQLMGLRSLIGQQAVAAGNPAAVGGVAQDFGAGPRAAAELAALTAATGPDPAYMAQMAEVAPQGVGMDVLDEESQQELGQVIAFASQGISPRQMLTGAQPDPNMPLPAVPTERVIQEVTSILTAQGYGPAAIDQAVSAIRAGYKTG